MLMDYATALRLQRKAERGPSLTFTLMNLPALLEQVRSTNFPTLPEGLEVFFIDRPFLASIHCWGGLKASVFIRDILNRPETPDTVLRQSSLMS